LVYFFTGGQGPAKIIGTLNLLAFLVLFFQGLKKHTSYLTASLFSLFLITMPRWFEQSIISYTNLPAAFFLGLAVIKIYDWLKNRKAADLALAGLMLGVAVFARGDALPFALLIIALTALVRWRSLGWILVPIILAAASWQLFLKSVLNYNTGSLIRLYPVWEPERAVKILGDFLAMPFEIRVFGFAFFVFIIAALFLSKSQPWEQKQLLVLVLLGFAAWYLMFYQLRPNFDQYARVWGSPFSSAGRVLLILAPPALFYSALRFHSIIKKTLLS
jgi:hypothetical protein